MRANGLPELMALGVRAPAPAGCPAKAARYLRALFNGTVDVATARSGDDASDDGYTTTTLRGAKSAWVDDDAYADDDWAPPGDVVDHDDVTE